MERIRIKNFRKIKGTWELDLSPITFFTGTNNSGKSSVLKAIMALDDFGDSKNHLELSFNGRNSRKHKIDSYNNAVNWLNQEKDNLDMESEFDHSGYEVFVSFTPLEWENQKLIRGGVKQLFFQRKRDGAKLNLERKSSVEYQFYAESKFFERRRRGEEGDSFLNQQNDLKKMFLKEIKDLEDKKAGFEETEPEFISVNQNIAVLSKKLNQVNKQIKEYEIERDELIFSPTVELDELPVDDLTIDRIVRNTFSKYFRENQKQLGLSDNRQDFHRAMMVGDRLRDALNFRVEHLSPHRNNQVRLYMNDNKSSDIYSIINDHAQDPIPKSSKAGMFIKKWMEVFDIGTDYRIKPVEGVASIIQVKEGGKDKKSNSESKENSDKGLWINIVDKGFGAGQVFTIILRIAMTIHQNRKPPIPSLRGRKPTPIILIEEPEANLHPAFQAELANLFLDAFKSHGIKFIIETHSEYLLRKSQVLVNLGEDLYSPPNLFFEGKAEKEFFRSFGIYYFDKEKGPYKMEYREDGKFKNEFGPGFFDESSNLAFEIL
jgi:predicted ATPase